MERSVVRVKERRRKKKEKDLNSQFNFGPRVVGPNRYNTSYHYFLNDTNMDFNYFGYNSGLYSSRELANSYSLKRGGYVDRGGGYVERGGVYVDTGDYMNSSFFKRGAVGGGYNSKDSVFNVNYSRGLPRRKGRRRASKYNKEDVLKGKRKNKDKRNTTNVFENSFSYDAFASFDSFNFDHSFNSVGSFKNNKNVDHYVYAHGHGGYGPGIGTVSGTGAGAGSRTGPVAGYGQGPVQIKHVNLLGDLYPKISYYLKKNRKYLQRILKKNYTIRLYMIRHAEALHNREVINSPDIPRDYVYRKPIMSDCPLSPEGYNMCEKLKDGNEYYKEIMHLYNASLNDEKNNTGSSSVLKHNRSGMVNSTDSRKGIIIGSGIDAGGTGYIGTVGTIGNVESFGVFERNRNFVAVCSPLKRCLETMNSFLNIKKNIVVHEAVRETAGDYFCDERSKTSEVKNFCSQNFEEYELLCYGEEDIIDGTKIRESRSQVECRCLQFLKFIHSLAINYFASIEKKIEEKEIETRKKNKDSREEKVVGESAAVNSLLNGSSKNEETEKLKKVTHDTNKENPEKEEKKEPINNTLGRKEKDTNASVGPEAAVEEQKGKGADEDEHLEGYENEVDNSKVYNVVLVSHSSFINHLLALLDFLELDQRVLANCGIRKISIPLTSSYLFYNSVTNLQSAKPSQLNTIPFSFKNKNKLLKKTLKDKYIYNVSCNSELDQIICTHPCTFVIYRRDLVSEDKTNQLVLEKIQKCIENNNRRVAKEQVNETNNEEGKEKEKSSRHHDTVYSNGIYKNFVLKNKHLGRKVWIVDGTDGLKYLKEEGAWEIKKRGLFLRQNVIIIVLPNIDIYPENKKLGKGEYVGIQEGEKGKEKEKGTSEEKAATEEVSRNGTGTLASVVERQEEGGEKEGETKKGKEELVEGKEVSKEKKKNKKNEKSQYFENVKMVIDNYDNINDLMKSKKFWKVLKDNIKNMDLYTFHEFLLEKFHTIIKNETDVCYLDLVECIKNKSFMEKYQNACGGYLKKLKKKFDRNMFIDFEQECKYINDNLVEKMFDEYRITNNNNISTTVVGPNETKTNLSSVGNANLLSDKEIAGKQEKEKEKGQEKEKEKEKGQEKEKEKEKRQEKEKEKEKELQIYVKRKFIYIPKKSHVKNEKQPLQKYEKNFFVNCMKLLKHLPTTIQNLDIEIFYQDHFFYIHCLHRFIKSKDKREGIVIAKLLCCYDFLKSFTANKSDTLFQKLLKVHDHVYKNSEAREKTETVDSSKKTEKGTTFLCQNTVTASSSTIYCTDGLHKYKTIQSLSGKKKCVADDLNYLRYNLLTVSGGAENVFILNVTN